MKIYFGKELLIWGSLGGRNDSVRREKHSESEIEKWWWHSIVFIGNRPQLLPTGCSKPADIVSQIAQPKRWNQPWRSETGHGSGRLSLLSLNNYSQVHCFWPWRYHEWWGMGGGGGRRGFSTDRTEMYVWSSNNDKNSLARNIAPISTLCLL